MSASFRGPKISWSRPSRYENSEPGGRGGRSGMMSSGLATSRPSGRVLTEAGPWGNRSENRDHGHDRVRAGSWMVVPSFVGDFGVYDASLSGLLQEIIPIDV